MSENNTKPAFSGETVTIQGTVTREPRFLEANGDRKAAIFIPVAVNSRSYTGEEGVRYYDVVLRGIWAEQAQDVAKGNRIIVSGSVTPSKDHEEYKGWTITATTPLALSTMFQDVSVSKREPSGGSRRNDEGDAPRGRSRRDEDDDNIASESSRGGGGRGRGRASDDDFGDAGMDEQPSGRGRGRGRGRAAALD